MNAVTPADELSGLEQLRAVFDADHPERGPGIGKTLGFTVVELEEGRVVFGGHPDERVYNPIGTVHGGYAASLLDSCVGCAVHTLLPPGKAYTTLELKVNFVKGLSDRVPLVRAIGHVIHSGSRVATADGRLVGPDGTLYAHATTTCLIFDPR